MDDRGEAFPLSLTQQDIYFDQLHSGRSPLYNVGGYIRMGRCDVERLRSAHARLVSENDVFGIRIRSNGSGVRQEIASRRSTGLPLVDLSQELDPAATAKSRLDSLFQEPFHLEDNELYRAHLLKLADDQFWYVCMAHHLIMDGWGFRNLARVLGEFYHGQTPESPLAWRQIVASDEGYLTSEKYRRDREHWLQHLGQPPAKLLTAFHEDRFKHLNRVPSGRETIEIDHAEYEGIRSLAEGLGVGVAHVLLGVLATYFSRAYGRERLVVGVPAHNRRGHGEKQMLGAFTSVSPLGVTANGSLWFADLARALRDSQRKNFRHQRYPIGHLFRDLGLTGRNSLYDIAFNYLKLNSSLNVGGQQAELVYLTHFHEATPLMVNVWEYGEGLPVELQFDYNHAYFEPAEAALLAGRILQMLRVVVEAGGNCQIADIPLLSGVERRQLSGFNKTAVPYPGERCIHTLIEAQVRRSGAEPAVSFEGRTLSYAELNTRSNQVAHFLIRQGVGPDVVVGLFVERSLEMVVGLLGILKAGAAYLPLEPDLPEARLRYMLENSRVQWLLTRDAQMARLGWPEARTLVLDQAPELTQCSGEDPLVKSLSPDCLAYVIYTSGSTGQPKGVMVEHRALVNRIDWMQREYQLRPDDVVLQKTPFGFDVSVWEFMWPLIIGARLEVAKPEGHKDPAYLARLIQAEGVTTLHFVPSMLRAMVSELGWSACRSVRHVFCSGEALTGDLVGLHYRANRAALHNLYGPTEAAIDVSYWPCPVDSAVTNVPIGRPIQNIQLHVLDPTGLEVPVGVPGELHIAGVGLARGYLNRPELTSERFIKRHLAGVGEVRLYKTGDLARWLPDGTLSFHGRLDHQVKIRGFRIELGEIEAQLLHQDGVANAVVVARESDNGDKQLVAYVAAATDDSRFVEGLRSALRKALPSYMVPNTIVVLEALPLTASGKIDRRALPEPGRARDTQTACAAPTSVLESQLCEIWRELLNVHNVGVHDHFFEAGGNSLLAVETQRAINARLGSQLQLTDMFAYPTVADLARFIGGSSEIESSEPDVAGRAVSRDIAIIAAACRFPDATTPESFWENLCKGHESIQFFSDEELRGAGVPQSVLDQPNYVKSGFVLDGLDQFDASFFRFTPREADLMDPQQRLLFEIAEEALERGGHGRRATRCKTGVFVAVGQNRYWTEHILPNRELLETFGETAVMIGNRSDFAATRLSHKLDLKGPSVSVGSACSSSLVAVHLACQSLLDGSCDMALAGASNIAMYRPTGVLAEEGGIASRDGRCRAFDADADGTRPGSGAGIVLLRRLDDAVADGDPILAVIKGSAINNDGANKVGFTAPSVEGQAAVINEALRAAGVASSAVTYVEAHGTGTKLGDPIEVAALRKVFPSLDRPYCAIGSVKPNIGHLDTAAGMAGLIKAAKALEQRKLPPQILFSRANPEIDLDHGPFRVNRETVDWEGGSGLRTAGVNSFGIGGTNAHVVIQQPPVFAEQGSHREEQLILLSAKSESALSTFRQDMAEFVKRHPQTSLADMAYTLQIGRASHSFRTAAVARSVEELAEAMADSTQIAETSGGAPEIVFMFPGQGSQHIGMGREIHRQEPVFGAVFDRCAELLEPQLGLDIRRVLFDDWSEAERLIDETWITQPLLFAFEYSLAELLRSWGILPTTMIGHSLGEYVAACLAGVFDLSEALKVVAARGRLMQGAERGGMLAVCLSESRLSEFLARSGCELAAVNADEECVAAGSREQVACLEALLARQRIVAIPLETSHAFHTALMEPILNEFRSVLESASLNPPTIPYISNVTGQIVGQDEARDPDYWLCHLRSAVRFGAGAKSLRELANPVFVEVGPGSILTSLVQRGDPKAKTVVTVGGRRDHASDERTLLEGLGKLWMAGVEFEQAAFFSLDRRRKVVLPTHPFLRRRHWVDRPVLETGSSPAPADGLHLPTWQRADLAIESATEVEDWLVVEMGGALGSVLARELDRRGQRVRLVGEPGGAAFPEFTSQRIDLLNGEECRRLAKGLLRESFDCARVVISTLNESKPAGERGDLTPSERVDRFMAALNIVRAVAEAKPGDSVHFDVLTRAGHSVTGLEEIDAEAATMVGLCKVIPQEFSGFSSRQIDLDFTPNPGAEAQKRLIDELMAPSRTSSEVAHRGCHRWVRSFTPLKLADWFDRPSLLRNQGVYVITGGLGRVGLAIAETLAAKYQAKLALVARSDFPAKPTWKALLNSTDTPGTVRRQIAALTEIVDKGGEVLTLSADVTDPVAVDRALTAVEAEFGAIHGVVHGAGLVDGAATVIQDMSREHVASQFAAKVLGIQVLERQLRDRDFDFFLSMSSLSTVLGGLGFSAYAAANAFLDSFTHQKRNQGDRRWISINWDAWDFHREGEQTWRYRYRMSPREGQRVFELALRKGCGAQIVNSNGPLHKRLLEWARPGQNGDRPARPSSARPETGADYVAPRFRIETELAEIWRRFLGVEKIGVNDDFFSLGGDSLLLARVVSEINRRWKVSVSIKTAFDRSTIVELAVTLAGLIATNEENESVQANFVEELI